jgi:hypothetical protein
MPNLGKVANPNRERTRKRLLGCMTTGGKKKIISHKISATTVRTRKKKNHVHGAENFWSLAVCGPPGLRESTIESN